MALSKKQEDLDVKKWLESEAVGHDLCGEFNFCAKCDKSQENPCASAYDSFNSVKAKKPAAKPAAKKPAAPKTAAKK